MSLTDKASTLAAAIRSFGTAVDTKTDNTNTGKEPTIVGTTVADFYSGAKTWVNFSSTARAVTLTGLSTGSATAIAAADSILVALGKAQAQIDTKAAATHNHNGVYQPLDNDLTAIAALAGTSGFLKKTATDTWALDTSTYITGNQNITLSGDATGSGSTSIAVTLANSGVTAGTYNNSATAVMPFTVDAKGRITATGVAVTITPAFSSVTGKPTTLSGYGITDASPLAGSASLTTVGTISTGTWQGTVISPTYGGTGVNNGTRTLTVSTNSGTLAFSGASTTLTVAATASVSGTNTGDQTITLTGDATGSGTGSFAVTLANSGVTAGTYNNTATAITPFTVDAKGRVTGTGAAVTITPAWTSVTGKPTTLAGYGITDGVNKTGDTMSGILVAPTFRENRSAMAAVNIDLTLGGIFTKTISGATTFTVSNVPAAGTTGSFMLDLTNGGSAAITWWSGVKWAGGTAPTLTASGRDVLGFFTHDGGTTWTGLVLGKDVK